MLQFTWIMKSTTAILLLHFKNSPFTKDCLDSLAKVKGNFHVYIVSIQSELTKAITDHKLKPHIIETDINGGFSWANNLLIKAAMKDGCQKFILLNNDTTVDENFLKPLEAKLDEPAIGMVCSKIYFYPGYEYHQKDYTKSEQGKVIWYMGGIIDWRNVYTYHYAVDEVDHGQFEVSSPTDFATGCCTAITKSTINKIGLMNEKYFLYYEDTDWSYQAKLKGFEIVVEPKSIVYHKSSGSTGGPGSKLAQYYQGRNRFYFGMRFAPLKTKLHLIKNTLRDLFSKDELKRKASKDALLFRMGPRYP